MAVKILGLCGSPWRQGNTVKVLEEALKACGDRCQTELITLAGLKIAECTGCLRCFSEGTLAKPCPPFDDDMTPIYTKLMEADGFLFASPVYYGSVTGLMKTFMDRFYPFYESPDSHSELKDVLRFKPAGAIAVGGGRNDGIESTLFTFYRFFLYNRLLIIPTVGITAPSGRWEDVASGLGGTVWTEGKSGAVERDTMGVDTVKVLARRVAFYAEAIKNNPQLKQ